MSVNFRFKATKIIGQRKTFYRQRIPESSCARKKAVCIDILVTSRNGDRKIMKSNRITSNNIYIYIYIYIYCILLRFNHFGLSNDREGWCFGHSGHSYGFACRRGATYILYILYVIYVIIYLYTAYNFRIKSLMR